MHMLVTEQNICEIIQHIEDNHRVVVDLETTGLSPFGMDSLCGVAIAIPDNMTSYYFPFRHGKGFNLDIKYLEVLLNVLSNRVWTTWNGKFDLKFMRKEYARLPAPALARMGFEQWQAAYPPKVEDVMLAAHLMNENDPNFKLKSVGERYGKFIGYNPGEASAAQQELYKYLSEKQLAAGGMWKAPSEVVGPYAEQDVILTEKLRNMYETALKRWDLYELWQELNDYLVVVEKIEERGIQLDMDRVLYNLNECDTESKNCLKDIENVTGIPLNPNSAVAYRGYINTVLNNMDMPLIPSTSIDYMEGLLETLPTDCGLYNVVERGVQFRRWIKAKSAYYDAFVKYQVKGVLHPNLHQTGTVTGRFSSGEPNMQAIPRQESRPQPKNKVKEVFVARPGYWLVEVDYKMAEIYIITHFSKAKHMAEMLRAGVDVHAETAKMMGDIPRAIAKRINFAIAYGIGPKSFVEDVKAMTGLEISLAQASHYLNHHRTVHPEFSKLYVDMEIQAQQNGYIKMITGRMRRYNGREHFGKDGSKPSPYQKASSNLVQGSVGEIMRLASTEIDKQLGKDVHQLLHVHDSMLFEVPEGEYGYLFAIKDIMEFSEICGNPLMVPMKVDIKIGYRWSDLKEWKPV